MGFLNKAPQGQHVQTWLRHPSSWETALQMLQTLPKSCLGCGTGRSHLCAGASRALRCFTSDTESQPGVGRPLSPSHCTPCHRQGHLRLSQVVPGPIQADLESSQGLPQFLCAPSEGPLRHRQHRDSSTPCSPSSRTPTVLEIPAGVCCRQGLPRTPHPQSRSLLGSVFPHTTHPTAHIPQPTSPIPLPKGAGCPPEVAASGAGVFV